MKLRTVVTLAITAFAAAMAVMVSNRISAESLAMLVGIACGICATIPVSLLALWLARRPSGGDGDSHVAQRPYPPVVVVAPGAERRGSMSSAYYPSPALPSGPPRQFTIVGEEETVYDGRMR